MYSRYLPGIKIFVQLISMSAQPNAVPTNTTVCVRFLFCCVETLDAVAEGSV